MLFKIIIIASIFIIGLVNIKNFMKAKEIIKKRDIEKKKIKRYSPRKNYKRERSKNLDNKYLEVKKNSNIIMGTSFIGCLFVIIIIFIIYYRTI